MAGTSRATNGRGGGAGKPTNAEHRRGRRAMATKKVLANSVIVGAGLAVAAAIGEAMRRLTEQSLHGDVALITGGSRGLGLALAREFAKEGCRLAICARDEAELERARRELE